MPAEILFAGGRLDSLTVIGGSPIESTSAGVRDATYADAAVFLRNSADIVRARLKTAAASVLSDTTVVSGETLSVHWDAFMPTTAGTVPFEIRDSSDFPWVRIGYLSASTMSLQWNSGTGASPVWTSIGPVVNVSQSLVTYDVRVTLGSPHSVEFYIGGTLVSSATFTQALFTNAASLIWRHGAFGSNHYISQLLASRDMPIIGAKVRYSRPTANGANTAWTGVFTDVNEAIQSDATINQSGTAAQKETHAMGDITIPTGFVLHTVFHWMRAKNDGVAPNNIRSVLRSGGVDYSTGDLSGIGVGFAPIGARYEQDPATAAAWNQAGFNALEAGYESAT